MMYGGTDNNPNATVLLVRSNAEPERYALNTPNGIAMMSDRIKE